MNIIYENIDNVIHLVQQNIWNPIILPFLKTYNLPTNLTDLRQDIYNINRPFTHKIESSLNEFVNDYKITHLELILLAFISFFIIKKIVSFLFCKKKIRTYTYTDDRTLSWWYKTKKDMTSAIFQFLYKWVPPVRAYVDKKIDKAKSDYVKDLTKSFTNQTFSIPKYGMRIENIEQRLQEGYEKDDDITNKGKISGTRYCLPEYEEKMKEFVGEYIFHNPLHAGEFPSSRQMEAEVHKMTCKLYGSKYDYAITTQGGSESIMMGVLAHRNYYQAKKQIDEPNIIMPISAHVAFNKACSYYKIIPIIVGLNEDNTVNINEVKKAINKNTIMIVGSNPSYACGAQDDIPALAKLALKYDVGLHVDSCLGSFVMPFAADLGVKDLSPFDFSVKGVTSISCDHHKYGMAPKGISLCMFSNPELRQYAYFSYSEWPGGLYATAQPAGSRSSAPIAGAWFAMMYNGMKGYKEAASQVLKAGRLVREAIREIPDLQLLGKQDTFVVGFTYKKHIKQSIYQLDNEIHSKGWTLNGLQKPNSLHLCITLPVSRNIQQFIKDLKDSVKALREDPTLHAKSTSGSVGLYGASGEIPDSATREKVLSNIVDCFTKLRYDDNQNGQNSNKTPPKKENQTKSQKKKKNQ